MTWLPSPTDPLFWVLVAFSGGSIVLVMAVVLLLRQARILVAGLTRARTHIAHQDELLALTREMLDAIGDERQRLLQQMIDHLVGQSVTLDTLSATSHEVLAATSHIAGAQDVGSTALLGAVMAENALLVSRASDAWVAALRVAIDEEMARTAPQTPPIATVIRAEDRPTTPSLSQAAPPVPPATKSRRGGRRVRNAKAS